MMSFIHEDEMPNAPARPMSQPMPSLLAALTIEQLTAIRYHHSPYSWLAHAVLCIGWQIARKGAKCAIERVIVRAAEELCRISTPDPAIVSVAKIGDLCAVPDHPMTLAEVLEREG